MEIRTLEKKDYNAVLKIAEKLKQNPEQTGWFDENARNKMIPFDIKVHKGFVAEEDDNVLGFVTWTSYDYHPIIGWIGVDPDYHRKGTGRALIEAVKEDVKQLGGTELYVETPTREAGLGTAYERTYKFYTGVGFELERIRKDDEPDNECNCDMAVLKMVLK